MDYCPRCHRSMPSLEYRKGLRFNYMHPRYEHARVCNMCTGAVEDAEAQTRRNNSEQRWHVLQRQSDGRWRPGVAQQVRARSCPLVCRMAGAACCLPA